MKRGAKTETFLHPVTPQLFFLKCLCVINEKQQYILTIQNQDKGKMEP